MFPRPIEEATPAGRFVYRLAVLIVLLLWLLPLLAIVLTSFRTVDDLARGNYWGWPSHIAWTANYQAVFSGTPLPRYFLNSLIITVPSVIGVLILSTLSGYALSQFHFRGSELLFAVFVGGNFIPQQILMIPVRQLMVSTGLYDTYFALIIFHVAFQTGFATLFMRNFISAIPRELFEAARAEGVTPFQILRHVVLPLMRPALAALSILAFTFIWNDYFWSIVLTQSDAVKPVTAGLANLRGQFTSQWNLVSAATIAIAIPPVLMFFFMQKHFVAGLTAGAVKG